MSTETVPTNQEPSKKELQAKEILFIKATSLIVPFLKQNYAIKEKKQPTSDYIQGIADVMMFVIETDPLFAMDMIDCYKLMVEKERSI